MEGFLDPEVIKKGMEEIKAQMREVQREAQIIETDMQSRFQHMTMQNEAKRRNVPASLTTAIDHSKGLKDEIAKIPSYNKTRELIVQRLRGPFDYSQFTEDIRKLKV